MKPEFVWAPTTVTDLSSNKKGDTMSLEQLRTKVQRILTDIVGTVRVDKDGDFRITYKSATVFIECWSSPTKNNEQRLGVKFTCPLVKDVPATPELFKWIAIEGSDYRFGTVSFWPDEDGETGLVLLFHNIFANDIDASEVQNALLTVLFTAADLDTELQAKFGGEMIGSDDD